MRGTSQSTFRFDRFRFDPENGRLDGPSGRLPLNFKAAEVLRVLIERRGRLVRKDDLLDAVWPDVHVGDGVLKVRMAEIRSALGDSARRPRFIETVHRRGYRFLASADETGEAAAEPRASSCAAASSAPALVVGRAREIAELEDRVERALRAERQIVLIAGEAGIGKTALVDHVVASAVGRGSMLVARGACFEQLGPAEPYMPVLQALGGAAREHPVVATLLRRFAPTWLAQLPCLRDVAGRADARRGEPVVGSRASMLRELAELVEALAAEIPVVLVLEDLQWSDPSTVDVLSLLAARRDSARLLVVATYRPAEVILGGHPLDKVVRNLAPRPGVTKIALDALDADAVAAYLEQRFGDVRSVPEAARLVQERSDGNPLFARVLLDDLVARGAIVARDGASDVGAALRDEPPTACEALRLTIQGQLACLTASDRELLDAASVVGIEFSLATVAAAAGIDAVAAERRCECLTQAGVLVRVSGAVAGAGAGDADASDDADARYAFRRPLQRAVLLAAVPPLRRRQMQLRVDRVVRGAHAGRDPETIATDRTAHAPAIHLERDLVPLRRRAVAGGANRRRSLQS